MLLQKAPRRIRPAGSRPVAPEAHSPSGGTARLRAGGAPFHACCAPGLVPVLITTVTCMALAGAIPAAMAGGTATLIRETVELAARRSGRALANTGARESAEVAVRSAVSRHGPRAAAAIADGGLELVEAGARHGDDVLRLAMNVGPEARRPLALDPGNLVRLGRELGPEALELESRSPGLARRVFLGFGGDGARRIAASVPADDLPRLVAYAERADSPQTRKVLLEAYEKEGPGIFQRIPPSLVLAGGLTASMIHGTHRATAPLAAVGEQIAVDPSLARRALDWIAMIGGALTALVTWSLLRSCGLLRPRCPRPERSTASRSMRTAAQSLFET